MAKTQRNKRNRKGKNKTKNQKRTIKNKKQAKFFLDLLNHAYKCITSSYHDLFDKEDYLLLPYISDQHFSH